MENKKTYLFDFGGVIFHLNLQKTYAAFEKILGINHQKFYHQYHQPDFFDQHERGEIDDASFLLHIKNINPKLNDQNIIDAWNAMLIGIPEENLIFIEQLAKENDLYLLSNTNHIHWQKVHEFMDTHNQRQRFYKCFKKVFLSFEIGMRKPESRIYHYCLSEMGLKAEEVIFIDDNHHNIEAAKKCGLISKLYPLANPLLREQFSLPAFQ